MSKHDDTDFQVPEKVSFLRNGRKLFGKIVRVYHGFRTGDYDVLVNGKLYTVSEGDDHPDQLKRDDATYCDEQPHSNKSAHDCYLCGEEPCNCWM